ncbi:MAG: hypothetical protein L0K30_09525, partial [Acidipropionibacterium jensenii]|uniref:hypothetical protein n=1 Tax=Acidipropionibacterium jensenii TaxID=1749 RepID=UPI00264763F6
SNDAPLYGVGIRQGLLVAIPNTGGQWSAMFSRADIEIQIVGRTREWVERTQRETIQKVFEVSRQRQGAAYTDPQKYITPTVMPLTGGIQQVTVGRPAQMMALVALMAAALLAGGWGAVIVDRGLAGRPPRDERSAA